MKTAYVYILTNKRNGTLYIGVTENLATRMDQHKAGKGSQFTAKYGTDQLVWFAEFVDKNQAREQERRMKTWKRVWKLNAIETMNPDWNDLSLRLNE